MKIWVDDLRLLPEEYELQVVCSDTAIKWLDWHKRYGKTVELLSLDHDLGGEDTTRPIVLWMIENDFWPVEIRVHSQNPVGRHWLESMIDRYKP